MKIYVGTKTGVEYLWGIAHDLKCEYEIKKQCGNIHANARTELNGSIQNATYLNRLGELILGKSKFSIGYLAVTGHANYYSDSISKVIIQVTGCNISAAATKIAEATGLERTYVYQIITGSKPLTPKVSRAINKATDALLLCCLAEQPQCFGPGINFTPNSDWEFIFDDAVKQEMYNYASATKDDEEDDFYIDDAVNDDSQLPAEELKVVQQVHEALNTNELDLFEQLSPSMKKLVLEFARKRANCGTMTNEQIVLSYCIQVCSDKSIQDLIRTVGK